MRYDIRVQMRMRSKAKMRRDKFEVRDDGVYRAADTEFSACMEGIVLAA